MPAHVVRLYESTIPSGNAQKVRLLIAHLGLSCEVEQLDILASPSETRRPEFLAKNPSGRIPVVELSDGTYLAESNAILCYLAEGTPFLPSDPLSRARALSWLFFEQYSHERFIAVLKFWTYWGGLHNKTEAELSDLRSQGQNALGVMERHLQGQAFFTGTGFGVADIALYAYTRSAGDVGYDMERVPHVVKWLRRVESQPGHIHLAPR